MALTRPYDDPDPPTTSDSTTTDPTTMTDPTKTTRPTTTLEALSRRDFLRRTAGSLVGVGWVPLVLPWRSPAETPPRRSPGSSPAAGAPARRRVGHVGGDGLPPRTVGLRSLGGDFAFDPAGLRLEPGSELTWLNMGDFHTTTAFHPDNAKLLPGGVPLRIPEGAEPWHSGMLGLSAETEFTHAFRMPGVYDYFCQPHYSFGMVGRVVVPGREGDLPGARPASELNEASREELPAVDTILGPAGRAYEWAARINGVLLLRAHGEPTGDPAARLAERMAGDGELEELLERSGVAERARSALRTFVDAVRGEAGYETLVARADDAKAPLSEAADSLRNS